MLYHDIEYLTQMIQQNEAFLFLHDPKILMDGPSTLFYLFENAHKGYQKMHIVCNDDYGTHKC